MSEANDKRKKRRILAAGALALGAGAAAVLGIRGAKTVSLTDKETQLLLALLKNKNGVEKEALLKDVWGVTSELESHTLETHIYRLRAKLKETGLSATIAAAPGKYVLEI